MSYFILSITLRDESEHLHFVIQKLEIWGITTKLIAGRVRLKRSLISDLALSTPHEVTRFPRILKVKVLVAPSCPTLCDPMDWSLPGFSVHRDSPGKNTGVGCHVPLQGVFPTKDQTQVSHIPGGFFTIWATREAQESFSRGSSWPRSPEGWLL